MRRVSLVAAAVSAVLLSGCAGGSGDRGLVTVAAAPASEAGVQVIKDFSLYVHCGVSEARIGADYYEADPVLDDGNGNPPRGWGNPSQVGTMTVHADGTAVFTAGKLIARFKLRPGATDWKQLCS